MSSSSLARSYGPGNEVIRCSSNPHCVRKLAK